MSTHQTTHKIRKTLAVAGLSLLALAGCSSGGSDTSSAIPAPPSSGNILDAADLLTDAEETQLNQLIEEKNSDAAKVAIYTFDESHGDIENYAKDVANSWGVGDAGKENGVLIAVDMDGRKAAISTADGVREKLTDDAAQDIVDDTLTPALKDEKYAQGFTDTTNRVYDYAEHGAPPADKTGSYAIMGFVGVAVAALIGIIVYLWRKGVKARDEAYSRADAEIAQAQAEDSSLQVTDEMREAYRKYRLAYQKPPQGNGNEYNRAVEEEERENDAVYTRYAPTFGTWLPLYMMSPGLYSGIGEQPPSYTASTGGTTGSSFGGGSGFTGGGASGSF